MNTKIETIAVMTSGGDAPGMNAAIRAVVRTAINRKFRVVAIHNGYEGMIDGDFAPLDASSVSNIIHRGGTIIKTARSGRFEEQKWRAKAFEELKKAKVDGVVLIGGNGSLAGAHVFTSEFEIPFIGIPKTIDNDVYGTDYSIGFDTATNTALEAIDRIRDTADSHHRLFFVEVMGRDSGFIALHCGMAAGAEAILLPETGSGVDNLIGKLESGWQRNKSSLIVVVAEGAVEGGAMELARKVKAQFDHYDTRVCVLGHMQRGGNPSCFDRILAGTLGNEAVKILADGTKNSMVGIRNNRITCTSLKRVSSGKPSLNFKLAAIANELSL